VPIADSLDDLIVGAHKADTSGKVAPGRSYVVFGKTDNTAIDLSAIASGTGGFVIRLIVVLSVLPKMT
jgi:TctA family transporter